MGYAGVSSAKKAAEEARIKGADFVVALGHLGEQDTLQQWRASEVIANTNGIDVMIDGHSHEQYERSVQNNIGQVVLLAQTGTQPQSYGKVVIDPTSKAISTELVGPPATQDPATDAFVKNIEAQLSQNSMR